MQRCHLRETCSAEAKLPDGMNCGSKMRTSQSEVRALGCAARIMTVGVRRQVKAARFAGCRSLVNPLSLSRSLNPVIPWFRDLPGLRLCNLFLV